MKKSMLIFSSTIIITILICAFNANVSYTNNEVLVAKTEYVEYVDPFDFSDEPLMDEETAKLQKEKEAYERKNAIEKAIYNKRYVISIIAVVLVIVITATVVFLKLNKKRWK